METYTIMHNDIPVADIPTIDGYCVGITKIHNAEHIMPGTMRSGTDKLDISNFCWTWNNRQIPLARQNLDVIQFATKTKSPGRIAIHANFANLSDHYWAKPSGSDLQYRDINFYHNAFSAQAGIILIAPEIQKFPQIQDMANPGCCTNGNMPKSWALNSTGTPRLYKTGMSVFEQEPVNEKLASILNRLISAPHVDYDTTIVEGRLCSACTCATSETLEFIPAYSIIQDTGIQDWHMSAKNPIAEYQDFAEKHEVEDITLSLTAMIITDYIMRNTDRHWNNFGLLRNPKTLKYFKAMPLFDYGDSLYHNMNLTNITPPKNARSRLTNETLFEDLQYLRPYDIQSINIANLIKFPDHAGEILATTYMTQERRDKILNSIRYRVNDILDYFA